MATWDPPSDAEIDVDKPIKAIDIRRIRDLSQAMAEGAAGAPLVGGLIPLATIVLNNDATADFTEFDAAKYENYIFKLANIIPVTDGDVLGIRTSTNGGSTYDSGASDYRYGIEGVNETGANSGTGSSGAPTMRINVVGLGSASGEDGFSGTVDFNGPHLAKSTYMTVIGVYEDTSGDILAVHGGGWRVSSADVDAVRFLMVSGLLESGTITMYGVVSA